MIAGYRVTTDGFTFAVGVWVFLDQQVMRNSGFFIDNMAVSQARFVQLILQECFMKLKTFQVGSVNFIYGHLAWIFV